MKTRPPPPLWQTFSGEPQPLDVKPSILDAAEKNLCVARLDGFLAPEEIPAVHELAMSPGAWEIFDRHESLEFFQRVWRIEEVMKQRYGQLYTRLIDAAEAVDMQLWQGLRDFAAPEIEYIVYDVEELGRPGSIAKHTDNESVVSVVVMLSEPEDYTGGLSCFKGKPARKVSLKPGDAVFFRGHSCEHWITPVTAGRRVVLQMELRDLRLSEPAPAAENPRGRKKRSEKAGAEKGGTRTDEKARRR